MTVWSLFCISRKMLIDSHCHLNFPDFKDDLPQVIVRAHEAGVSKMVSICTKIAEFPQIAAIADANPSVFCTVGVHPHEAEGHIDTTAEELISLSQHPKCIGIGETGLDYFYEHSPKAEQRQQFLEHIYASRQTGLPCIIHTRSADADTIEILQTQEPFPLLLHCFSTHHSVAEAALAKGGYISISGIVTFKSAEALRESVRQTPLNRLLVETDSPYLAPIPHCGQRNEPARTKLTAQCVAELKGISFAELAAATTANFHRLFKKAN